MADLDLSARKPVKKYDRRSITSTENGRSAFGKHLETQITALADSTKDERLRFDAREVSIRPSCRKALHRH